MTKYIYLSPWGIVKWTWLWEWCRIYWPIWWWNTACRRLPWCPIYLVRWLHKTGHSPHSGSRALARVLNDHRCGAGGSGHSVYWPLLADHDSVLLSQSAPSLADMWTLANRSKGSVSWLEICKTFVALLWYYFFNVFVYVFHVTSHKMLHLDII